MHLRPEIGSFDMISQDVPQSLKETRGSAGFPGGQEGSGPGRHPTRQAPYAAAPPTDKAGNDTRQ